MQTKRVLTGVVLVAVLAVAGCAAPSSGGDAMGGKAAAVPTAETMAAKPAPSAMAGATPEAMATKSEESMMDKPAPEAMATESGESMMDKPAPEAMATEPAKSMMDKPAPDAMAEKPAEAAADKPAAEAMMKDAAAPAWYAATLTDVNTGETFTVADLKGKVVLVEAMAVWCSTCLRQQREVVKLHEQLGDRDDYASVALGIDPNETADALREHAAKHGFDWKYALSPVGVSRELAALYGDQFINPPVAPMLVIDRTGEAHVLPFGVKSAEKLNELIQPFLAQGM